MLRRFSANFAVFSIFVDLSIIPAALWLVAEIRPLLNSLPIIATIPGQITLPPVLYVIFPLAWVSILALNSIYDGKKNLRVVDEFSSLTVGTLIASISLAGILYLTYRDVSRALFLSFILLTFLAMILWRLIARVFFRVLRQGTAQRQRVLIAGAGQVGRNVQAQLLRYAALNLKFVGFLDDDPEKRRQDPEFILGTLADIRTIVQDFDIDDVIIALPVRAHERTNQLAADLLGLPVKVWIIPDYFSITLHQAAIEDFAGIPMLDLRAPALTEYQRMLKRGFDVVATVLLLIPALPVMALASLLIVLDDGRPILFTQKRVGENGKLFQIYKFRTMVKNAEQLRKGVETLDDQGNLIHKWPDDPRVTRAGKILRRLSLDELPQFFNVLAGNMSLVGPRPELPDLVEKYQPWQRKRFAIPQGITGWWQIHGRSDKPMHLYTEEDLYYIQHYSIWLDILILIQTGWIVLRGKGAY
jgi:exopolysaccharide biosynthesis polyprenyl glycosylphosphotransferase